MGRTATAFLMLMAVGGCVADDSGPLGTMPAPKPGQAAVAPTYPTWARTTDQFAAMHDSPGTAVPATTGALAGAAKPDVPAAPPATKVNTTTVQKPASTHKPVVAAPPTPDLASDPTDVVVDSQLVKATLVTVPADKPEPESAKSQPAASHANIDVDQAAHDPAAPAIRMVNSKRVTLNFELKDVGASGVSGVELWSTQDAHAWKKGEILAQTSHSFTVEVKDEGLYGFTLLARNGAGVGKDAPANGEQPQVWVMVDVTKPVVQISSVEIGHGKTPSVEIHWSAKDKNLGPKPITLSYAEQPDGPWTPIAAGVENSGMYEWQPPATAPHHLYMRVEAVDMPGNTAAAQTANPLRLETAVTVAAPPAPDATKAAKPLPAPPALDTSRPTAAIMGVEPNGN